MDFKENILFTWEFYLPHESKDFLIWWVELWKTYKEFYLAIDIFLVEKNLCLLAFYKREITVYQQIEDTAGKSHTPGGRAVFNLKLQLCETLIILLMSSEMFSFGNWHT